MEGKGYIVHCLRGFGPWSVGFGVVMRQHVMVGSTWACSPHGHQEVKEVAVEVPTSSAIWEGRKEGWKERERRRRKRGKRDTSSTQPYKLGFFLFSSEYYFYFLQVLQCLKK